MKISLNKETDVLKVFNISCFKKVLKPIKVTNTEKFLDNLIKRADLIQRCLDRDFSLEDHEHIDLSCEITCNIPLLFSAHIGNGSNCWITAEKKCGESLQDHRDKKELLGYLESIILPDKIVFKTLVLNQRIRNHKSVFTLSLED
jgi:hypothetical protein